MKANAGMPKELRTVVQHLDGVGGSGIPRRHQRQGRAERSRRYEKTLGKETVGSAAVPAAEKNVEEWK